MTVMPELAGCDLSKYACSRCGVHGVRLFREGGIFLDDVRLLCCECGTIDQEAVRDDETKAIEDRPDAPTLGDLVAAIPAPPNTFWGVASIPDAGWDWWTSLPSTPEP